MDVFVRTAAEMAAVAADNPFPDRPPNRTMAIFLDAAPSANALESVTGKKDEELRLGRREIYVAGEEGMGNSLKIRRARTVRLVYCHE